ncbi:hypothetical protein [Novosphingobium sp. KN65.2]|uniref:hypothetical protein n=1 Tax=Novosphingobium sp. KN65.2 TaxID=1478134 RepID=UPI0005E8E10C|nr:hypothetical protein [Novosphingobium sp. KN65.2]CDO34045.1 hypothetical protein SPHV1_100079 [Novosphingobium sp. KN65.2]
MARKTNKTALAVVMQSAQGTFDTPSSTDDILAISNLQFNIQGVTATNNEYTGSIHKNGDDLAGKVITGSFNVYMRPPGGADVPAADAYIPGRFLKAAKFSEVRTTAAIPVAAEALGVGSDETNAVLGTTASTSDDVYKGMALLLSDIAATAYDKITAIRGYTGSSKTAELCEELAAAPAANYQIPKQLSYQRDVSETDAPFLSMSLWIDGLRYDLVDTSISGLRFNVPVSTRDSASQPMFEVSFTATIDDYADQATPSIPALGAVPLFKDGKFFVSKYPVGGSSVTVDFGLRSAYPPNPNYTDGSGPGELVESRTTVSMDRQAYLKAQFDTLALAEAQAQHPVFAQWGYASGAMVQLVIPDARFNYQSPQLGQDYVTEQGDMWVDVFSRNVNVNFPYFA